MLALSSHMVSLSQYEVGVGVRGTVKAGQEQVHIYFVLTPDAKSTPQTEKPSEVKDPCQAV